MGKASFAKLQDRTGQMQVFLQQDALGPAYEAFKGYDVGDILGAEGTLFKTKTGELTVRVTRLHLLAKSLRPLPDKWHGIADTELRYRRRYVDLVMSEESREVFRTRSRIVSYLRDFLDALDFLEVETPMLQVIPGGAAARPFVTHHNALDLDMYLRIAPELYLKRLVVGGFERVYEINRNFRNEGLSTQHNPEFTMLELYWAYGDYRDVMDWVEKAFKGLADAIRGTRQVEYQGRQYDLRQPFRRITVEQAILERTPTSTRFRSATTSYLHRVCERLEHPFRSRVTARASCRSRSSRRRSKHTLLEPDVRLRLSHGGLAAVAQPTMPILSSRIVSSSSSPGASWPTVSPSSMIPRSRRRAFAPRPAARPRATRRRCTSTRTTFARWNTACRRRRAWVWASTGW